MWPRAFSPRQLWARSSSAAALGIPATASGSSSWEECSEIAPGWRARTSDERRGKLGPHPHLSASADCKRVSGEWRVTRHQGRTKRRGVFTTEGTEMGRRGRGERDAVESRKLKVEDQPKRRRI